MESRETKTGTSGSVLIALIISILLVALFSAYAINNIYFKKSEEMKRDNDIQFETPNLENAQNQVESARKEIKEIENLRNKQIEEALDPE